MAWGPAFITLCFVVFSTLARVWSRIACGSKMGGTGVLEGFSRFVAAMGVAAAVDPYLTLMADLIGNNHHCDRECEDYTAPSCLCHEGDAWKLFRRLEAEAHAGIIGVFLTILVNRYYFLRLKKLFDAFISDWGTCESCRSELGRQRNFNAE